MTKIANKYHLYSELKRMYLNGELVAPEIKGIWMIFHLNQTTQALGSKGLTYMQWEDLVKKFNNG